VGYFSLLRREIPADEALPNSSIITLDEGGNMSGIIILEKIGPIENDRPTETSHRI
jgi:hypothetical protein